MAYRALFRPSITYKVLTPRAELNRELLPCAGGINIASPAL
jgi:hypothetical protein